MVEQPVQMREQFQPLVHTVHTPRFLTVPLACELEHVMDEGGADDEGRADDAGAVDG